MNQNDLITFERWYDSDFTFTLPVHLTLPDSIESKCAQLLVAHREGQWHEVFSISTEILKSENLNFYSKGLALEFAVSAAEVCYDMPLRKTLLLQWNSLKGWGDQDWFVYLRSYHDALTAFFSGHLRDAEIRFTLALERAEHFQYQRGRMICLYHLGLVAMERGANQQAVTFFDEAIVIAKSMNANRIELRISDQILSLKEKQIDGSFAEVEKLLVEKKFKASRKLLLHLSRIRRIENRKRCSDSLEVYFALTCIGLNLEKRSQRFLSTIDDLVMLEFFYTRKSKIFGLNKSECTELQYLQNSLGIKTMQTNTNGELEILGVRINQIRNQDIANFILLICSSPDGLNKQEICEKMWQFEYDPTRHDIRIYKLVNKARKTIGVANWIENVYGKYRLNTQIISSTRTPKAV